MDFIKWLYICYIDDTRINPLYAELNPICQLLALLGAHHIIHVSNVRVKVHFNPLNT
jgi:hypothetical protein